MTKHHLACTACLFLVAACGTGLTGPAAETCGPPPYFTVLPVAPADFDLITVIGGLGAPGHTLPTAHAGFGLSRVGAPVITPGPLQITEIRRVRFLVSPNRQGVTDYSANFQVCREISGWFGHLTTLAPTIPTAQLEWRNCETYSTAEETVENCFARPRNLRLSAGDPLGTGGLSIELGLMGLDFGMEDTRVNHFYVNRSLHPRPTFQAICPWEQFDAVNRVLLFSKLRDPAVPWLEPGGEPRCGTMQVDVANTAKGVWREPGVGKAQGDERRFITLANYPYRPEDHLVLSLGPVALGARVAVVPRQAAGRVNRAFEQVAPDGSIYCYTATGEPGASESWFLALTAPSELRMRRVTHGVGASPCGADPATWSVVGGMTMVR
jgi:hypothetical protein